MTRKKKLTDKQYDELIEEIVGVVDHYICFDNIIVIADVTDERSLIDSIKQTLSDSYDLLRSYSVKGDCESNSSECDVTITVIKYQSIPSSRRFDPHTATTYISFVKLNKDRISKLCLTRQESISQWVKDLLVKCIKLRTEYSTIVVPNTFDIRTVAKTMTTDSTWEIQVFPVMVEMVNKKSNYMISIMLESEFLNLDDNIIKESQCYIHHHCEKEVHAKNTKAIEVDAPDTLEVNEQDYSEVNQKVLDMKDEFMKDCEPTMEPIPTHQAIKESTDECLGVNNHPTIHGSGNEPRVFDSGFKRDSDLGKAKWSLLPPFTWKLLIPDVGQRISNFLLTGKVNELENALTFMTMHHGVDHMCKRYHGGAEKYGYFNWAQLGPLSAYLDSTGRHLWSMTDWGSDDENDPESRDDHIGAAMWGLSCMVHLVTLVNDGHVDKDLIDIPAYLDLVR